MEPDLDDTRRAALRPAVPPRIPDVDDTVVRGGSAAPPPLVEPPPPATRALPLVEPVAAEPVAADPVDADPVDAAPVPTAPDPASTMLRAGFADGTEIPLDTTVYVGRRPSRPRIHVGPEPRLIAFPSPSHEISATHLELRVIGGSVVASDMRSTNGTVVQLPGAEPRTLVRGESAVVVAGTRIDLGEGIVIDILPPLETAVS